MTRIGGWSASSNCYDKGGRSGQRSDSWQVDRIWQPFHSARCKQFSYEIAMRIPLFVEEFVLAMKRQMRNHIKQVKRTGNNQESKGINKEKSMREIEIRKLNQISRTKGQIRMNERRK
jgi:hypothetical protein